VVRREIGDIDQESLAKLFGVEHTFAKLVGLILCGALAFWSLEAELQDRGPFYPENR